MNIPDVVPGHWESPEGAAMARDYAMRLRCDIAGSDLSDMALANAVFMAGRNASDLVSLQTAAKERIRWLSVQLAIANAKAKQK